MSYPYQIKSLDQYKAAYEKSVSQPEAFWDAVASSFFWRKKWDKVLEWDFKKPTIKYYRELPRSPPRYFGRHTCYHLGV
jgi:acetyl-CoA synthetase